MALRLTNKIVGITGVVQGATANVTLDVGPRYHALVFQTRVNGTLTAAATVIDTVRIKVNETVIRELTAAQILAINALNGLTADTGELSIFFSEPGRADKVDEEATAWQTAGERSFKVELKIKTLANAGDVPTVEGLAVYDYERPTVQTANGPVLVKNIVRHTTQAHALASGTNNITTLERLNPILRILFAGSAALTEYEVKADSTVVREGSKFQNDNLLKAYQLNPAAFTLPIVFDYTERLDHYLVVGQSLNVRLTSASAQDVVSITETVTNGFN